MGYTDLQKKAIYERGGNLLVSASAGSGKTTVMIQRVLSLLSEGASLENMVICTFTRSAAADMRDKLSAALMERAERGDSFAEAQLLLLPGAEISTLHSWCQRLIRSYFYVLDVDPAFEIVDEAESEAMLSAAAAEAVEDAIARAEADFTLFYDIMLVRRGDDALKNLIKRTYRYSQTQPDPDLWLNVGAFNGFDNPGICDEIAAEERERLKRRFLPAAVRLLDETAAAGFTRNLPAAEALVARIEGKTDDAVRPSGKIPDEHRKLNEEFLRLKKAYSAAEESLGLYDSLPLPDSPPVFVKVLTSLVRAAGEKYAALKRKKARLDYADLEHLACRLVEDEVLSREITARFRYIFVDEYQDINPLQERIINGLKGGSLFLVGDIKQSIYAFRLCDPGIFLDKYERWRENGFLPPVELNDNFRSASEILEFANRVFSPLMTAEFGKLDYAKSALLKSGGGIAGGEVCLNLIVRSSEKAENKGVYSVLDARGDESDATEAETDRIVRDIAEKLAGGLVKENGGVRPVKYSDIAVLVSSRGSHVKMLYEKLKKAGIPVSVPDSVKFSSVYEVAVLCEFMKYLCNFTDDIALVSVLRSALVGITDDELADIKLAGDKNEKRFCRLCASYARNFSDAAAEKLKAFYALADRYLGYSYTQTAAEVIGKLVSEKKWFAHVFSLKDADVKADALDAFLRHLSSSPYGGSVGEYVGYLKLENDDFVRPQAADAVSVMTVHASKGLEFPFVYLAGTDKRFNMSDLSGKVIFDGQLGICMRNHDLEQRTVVANKLTFAAGLKLKRSLLEERMRLLYVALTRAKYGLYVYACADEDDELLTDGGMAGTDFEGGRSFFDWLRPAYAEYGFNAVNAADCRIDFSESGRGAAVGPVDAKLADTVRRYVEYEYPYPHAEVKSSVTAVNAMDYDDFPVKYSTGGDDDRAAERGSMYHKAMELIDFGADFDSEWRRLDSLLGIGGLVDRNELFAAFGKLGSFVAGRKFYREKQFVYNMGGVLVQGVIDLIVVGGESCFIVDYKTSDRESILSGAYDLQLSAYAAAAEEILGLKITAAYVYSFRSAEFLQIHTKKADEIKDKIKKSG